MSLHFISAENTRKPLQGILDSIIQLHIAHRLKDDFLILTPDETSARDLIDHFLADPRLGGVLTGDSILPFKRYIEGLCQELNPTHRVAPFYVQQALFKYLIRPQTQPSFPELISPESLYLLIRSFREEFLSANHLRNFVENFDPQLASPCGELFLKYAEHIDENAFLKDFVWQANFILKEMARKDLLGEQGIRRIYYLGFAHLNPLLKSWMQTIEKYQPEITQLFLYQALPGTDPRDELSRQWEEALPQLKRFQEAAPTASCPPQIKAYAGAFDEASIILRKISGLLKDGVSPNQIGLFVPSQGFWENYYSHQFYRMGLINAKRERKKLLHYKEIFQSTFSSPVTALEEIQKSKNEKKIEFKKEKGNALAIEFLSEEIRAFSQWEESLGEIVFYQEEYPFLSKYFPSLPEIAQHCSLTSKILQNKEIQIRSCFETGFLSFDHAFAIQLSDDLIPQNPDRFFGLSLPQSSRFISSQKAFFQHLSGCSANLELSYSKLSPQAQEKTMSPFLSAYSQTEEKPSRPFWFYPQSSSDLKQRLEIELRREKDTQYQHSHGGFISSPQSLEALRHWLTQHLFSPSQLEKYATCPFTFFSSKLLGIEAAEEKNIEGSSLDQGRWMHLLLEEFFKKNKVKLQEAINRKEARPKILEQLQENVWQFSKAFLSDKPWIHPDLFQDFSQRALGVAQEIIRHFWEQGENKKSAKAFYPSYFEQEFGGKNPVLRFDFEKLPPLQIGGRIDRIDLSEDQKEFIAWDYKTGEIGELSREIQEFTKLQLPLYLLAGQQLLQARPVAALAMGLKEMKFNQGLAKKEEAQTLKLHARSSCLLSEKEWNEFWVNFEGKLRDYYQKIYAGDFRTSPNPCSEYCDYRSICRYHERKKA